MCCENLLCCRPIEVPVTRPIAASASPGNRRTKPIEDNIDAVLCACIGAYWWYWGTQRNCVFDSEQKDISWCLDTCEEVVRNRMDSRWRPMRRSFLLVSRLPVIAISGASWVHAAEATNSKLERKFTGKVRPFLTSYCIGCHSTAVDLGAYTNTAAVIRDYPRWNPARRNTPGGDGLGAVGTERKNRENMPAIRFVPFRYRPGPVVLKHILLEVVLVSTIELACGSISP